MVIKMAYKKFRAMTFDAKYSLRQDMLMQNLRHAHMLVIQLLWTSYFWYNG